MTPTKKLSRLVAAGLSAVLVLGGAASASAAPAAAPHKTAVVPASTGSVELRFTPHCSAMDPVM